MKVLTATEFNRIGALLGGNQWRPSVAAILKIGIRTVEHYSAGTRNIPPKVRARLAEAAAIRSEELLDAARDILG